MTENNGRLPEDHFVCKKGGRPRNTERDISMLLAKRLYQLNQGIPTKKIIPMILEEWGKNKEIKDESTIWRAFREADKALEEFNFEFVMNNGGVIRAKVHDDFVRMLMELTSETEVTASSTDGIPVWMWHEGLERANFQLLTGFSFRFSPKEKK